MISEGQQFFIIRQDATMDEHVGAFEKAGIVTGKVQVSRPSRFVKHGSGILPSVRKVGIEF